eukprot:1616653-Pyramimonas_sp.AAC.1
MGLGPQRHVRFQFLRRPWEISINMSPVVQWAFIPDMQWMLRPQRLRPSHKAYPPFPPAPLEPLADPETEHPPLAEPTAKTRKVSKPKPKPPTFPPPLHLLSVALPD